MRNKVARRLRELALWHCRDGKWIKTRELTPDALRSDEKAKSTVKYTKNPAFAAYQQLKDSYKTIGTPMYSQDKGNPRRNNIE